jgi:CheY-like chemotaxis protein
VREAQPIILVVDDDGQVLEGTRDIVAALGYEVISARSGKEALSILRNDATIDLLFTDISMPGDMDGLGLVRHVSAEYPQVALLVTSGQTAPDAALLPQGTRFLAKPYTATALMEAIELASAAIPPKRIRPALFAI